MSIPTKEEALDIAKRYIDCAFQNKGELPRHSIPANPDRDDDIRLIKFIQNSIQLPSRQEGETPSGDMESWFPFEVIAHARKLQSQLSAKQAEVHSLKYIIADRRPLADCYERVCQSLGIENDILGFVKNLQQELESLKAAHATLVDQVRSHLNQFAWLDGPEGWAESCQALRASSFLPTPPVERSENKG